LSTPANSPEIERIATILADATVLSVSEVARQHGIHRHTVLNYRKRLEKDAALRQAYTEKLKAIQTAGTWESMVPDVLKAGMQAMLECFENLDRKSPDTLEAITKGITALTEIRISLDMMINDLDARKDGKADKVAPTLPVAPPPTPPRFVVHAATA
jgi:transposase-like protein